MLIYAHTHIHIYTHNAGYEDHVGGMKVQNCTCGYQMAVCCHQRHQRRHRHHCENVYCWLAFFCWHFERVDSVCSRQLISPSIWASAAKVREQVK